MISVPLKNMQGEQINEIRLAESVFGAKLNTAVLHEVVTAQLSNRRVGTACTKTRGEVSGGGRKPWPQKGTGRARVGSIRSPLWVGGGVVFGPKPRSYKKKVNAKKIKIALRSALSQKVEERKLTVLDKLELPEIKTKAIVALLDRLALKGTTLFILNSVDEKVIKSARNLPQVKVIFPNNLNVYDLLYYDNLIITKDALDRIQSMLSTN